MSKARELAELGDTIAVDGSGNATFDGDVSAANLSTTGNITVSGTVDGRDVAADGTKLDGIEAGATADQTITAGTGLTGGGSGDVTLSVDVGTTANKIVQLDGTAKLPAVDGSQLTGIVSIPSGVITLWSGSTASIPSGWVLCDGNNGTPDLRDRFVVGAGSTYAVAATGGSNTVALSSAEMPSHTHSVSGNTSSSGNHTHNGSTSNTGSHSHNLARGSGGGGTGYVNINFDAANQNQQSGLVGSAGSHSHNFTTAGGGDHSHSFSTTSGSAGSGTAHENRPPYYALAYIMKT